MFVFVLLGLAAATCSLPPTVDPNSACVEDGNGFSTIDADSDPDIPISLSISKKGETEDAFKVVHPGTVGALTDDTETDGRYILSCPQVADKKTVQFTISRPAAFSAFGAEWVQLFPKDSWENVTSEYEPFSFNAYGAKIPLAEFRPTSDDLADDAAATADLHVFMEVSSEGDFELKYGNPNLVSGGKWVAVEFKSTLLRVGAPWADCTDSKLADPAYSVGSIMPILFGGPNTNSVALRAGFSSYYDAIAELSGVLVPVKVVLEIFNADKTTYTSSAVDSQCYKAGPACPENHYVCKPEYCEMDVWAAIIAGFKAASPGMVTVLGSVDVTSTAMSAYDDLDVDGFYFLGTEATGSRRLSADGDTFSKFGVDWVNKGENNAWDGEYVTVQGRYSLGKSQITSVQTFSRPLTVEIDMRLAAGERNECLGLQWAANENEQNHAAGYVAGLGWWATYFGVGKPGGWHQRYGSAGNMQEWHTVKMEFPEDGYNKFYLDGELRAEIYDLQRSTGTLRFKSCATGDYKNLVINGVAGGGGGIPTTDKVSVAAIGAPLFDEAAVDDATVYVTLASSDVGLWSPFSWYPYTPPSKWAAIVTDATDTSAIATLVDRGYGWIYLTSEGGFDTKSTRTPAVLAALEAFSTTRRLQGRRLEASEPFWGCDDTLFECRPICLKQIGTVTTKVSEKLCAGAPMDPCACKCYHEAQWTCEGDAIVCKAKYGTSDLVTVGDKVCETRGAAKPASTAELRMSSQCEPITEMRGSAPTAECLAQWVTTPKPAAAEAPPNYIELLGSFAAPLAFAALALYA